MRRLALLALCLACSSSSPDDTVDSCGPSDFVAANQIDWTFAVSPRCVQIKAGQTVTWNGSFATHPLLADEGDKPNPIATADTSNGTSATVTFPTAGTFGFKCEVHASMTGAVLVTP